MGRGLSGYAKETSGETMAKKFEKLTRPAMRALPPKKEISEHGIRYFKLANGDGRFTVDLKVDRRRIHRVIGLESAGVTRQDAELFIEQMRTEARQDRFNLPIGRKTPLTFREAADKYLTKQEATGGKNMVAKRRHLQHQPKPGQAACDYLRQFFAEKPLNQIASFDIDRYKKWRKDAGASSGTINREIATLSHLFSCAVEWLWLPAKPTTLKRLKEEATRITYLTAEQADRLKHTARQDDNPQVFPFVMIGLATGMRLMEILSIRIEDIHLKDAFNPYIFIPKAKAGADVQPITRSLAVFLEEYIKMEQLPNEGWLFPSEKSKTGHTVNIVKAYKRTVKAAGFDPNEIVRHTLRHTAITHLVQAGVDIPTVKKISRHKTTQMVERYAHQNSEHIRAAMDKLEQRYQSKPPTPACKILKTS
jgi:integrase